MLEVVNVELIYSNVILVLKGISIDVQEGQIVAILGANGAGKTSILKSISGMHHVEEGQITRGSIRFKGVPIEKRDPVDIFRMGIVQVLEGRKVLEHLTAEQNLMVGSHLRSDLREVKKDIDLVYQYFPNLSNKRNMVSGYLSGGEQQMLVVGRALMARPKLMILDEPSLGLSPILVHEIFHILKELNEKEGITMLIVEQNVKIALSIAQHGYIVENGRVVLDGTAAELLANEDIKEFYLGLNLSGGRRSYKNVKHYKRRKRWLG